MDFGPSGQREWKWAWHNPQVEHVGVVNDFGLGRVDLDGRRVGTGEVVLDALHFWPGGPNAREAGNGVVADAGEIHPVKDRKDLAPLHLVEDAHCAEIYRMFKPQRFPRAPLPGLPESRLARQKVGAVAFRQARHRGVHSITGFGFGRQNSQNTSSPTTRPPHMV